MKKPPGKPFFSDLGLLSVLIITQPFFKIRRKEPTARKGSFFPTDTKSDHNRKEIYCLLIRYNFKIIFEKREEPSHFKSKLKQKSQSINLPLLITKGNISFILAGILFFAR